MKSHAIEAATRQSAALFLQTVRPISTGLCHPAQGWRSAPDGRGTTTLGTSAIMFSTLKGLHRAATVTRDFLGRLQPHWGWCNDFRFTQGSFATLGWKLGSLWDSGNKFTPSKIVSRFALLLGIIILPSAFILRAQGQSYSIDWYKVAGGGGTSTGGVYSVSGTIGQPDASLAMSGGSYSLTGGFWALISVVQTAGLPDLVITHSGNSVFVSWPNTGSYTLQQTANLAAGNGGWATSGYTVTTANGNNSVTVTPPTGNLFFRLKQ